MSRPKVWATKVAALIQGGNSAAALNQIKVAPSKSDLLQLRAILSGAKALPRYADIDQTITDQIVTLSSSRLHRSP